MLEIFEAYGPEQIAQARALMTEYASSLGFELCFQSFDQEMAGLPGDYAPPPGRLLLASWEGEYAGVIALRPLRNDPTACEMKRLYVRPKFRGYAIGRKLIERLITEARKIGYSRMVLDTVPGTHDKAIALYQELGFHSVAPYYDSPIPSTLYLELILGEFSSSSQSA